MGSDMTNAYDEAYSRSLEDPEGFWAEQAEQRLTWLERWQTVRQYDYHKAEIGWYLGGKLNACYNCVDRHVEAGRGEATALIWEGNDPSESKTYSYAELQTEVQKGKRHLIFLPKPRALNILLLYIHWQISPTNNRLGSY